MTDINRDDHILAAMRHPRLNRMEYWARELNEHRGHASFQVHQWPYSREYGYTCECSGTEREWRIGITSLSAMLPAARDSIQRIFRDHRARGNKKRKQKARKANMRARALLHQHLTKAQRWELRATKAFTVHAQDRRTYRVTEGTAANVFLLEDGEPAYRLCVVMHQQMTAECWWSLPMYDLMLAQKILLESNIRFFLQIACVRNVNTNMDLESGALLLDGEERTVLPRREAADDLPPIEIAEADIDEPTAWVLRQLQAATQGDENGSSSSGSQSPTESATVAE